MSTRQERNNERYRRLRTLDYDLYSKCVASASAIAINNDLDLVTAAEIEAALVALALRLIDKDCL